MSPAESAPLNRPATTPIRIGAWYVEPLLGRLSKGQESVKLEARSMGLLVYLAHRAGEVVSIDELLTQVWAGVVVTPDSVYQSIASLRRLLGDDPRKARYIATVPRMGYRMIADVVTSADGSLLTPVSLPNGTPVPNVGIAESPKVKASRVSKAVLAAAACAVLGIAGFALWDHDQVTSERRATIAVLPFLDLTTQEMNEEYFADGLTEELIGDLSGVPTFSVTSPTASFFYKGKQFPIPRIARELGVTFILDGSVRKSNNTYRVATRLVRAADGVVVWADAFERPLGNLVEVQKDIALQATKAVRASLEPAKKSGDKLVSRS